MGSEANPILVAVDIGTSACKVAAFSRSGSLLASESRGYALLTPRPGYVEQDPNDWWDATADALRAVTGAVDAEAICGVGVSGQSWSAVPVDEDGIVLANCPTWMDTRAQALCDGVIREIGGERLFEVGGNRFAPTYTLPKLLWFRQELPDVFARARFLSSNGFIVYRLTGAISLDVTQAYGLHFWNPRTGRFDEGLVKELDFDLSRVPEPVACHTVVGAVSRGAAAHTGLKEGTPVVAGGLDAACAAFGAGVMDVGETQEQGGQAGGMSIVCDLPLSEPRLILSRHVVPGRWLLQGGTVAGGASLKWALEQLGESGMTYRDLDAEAATATAGSGGLWFLPYLAGERGPIWDPGAKGVLFGLKLSTRRGEIWRAVMEGVAFSLLDNMVVAEDVGAVVSRIVSVGGAAASSVWTQIKADVLGREIGVCAMNEASTLGAAVLAGVGMGVFGSFDEVRSVLGQVQRTYLPDATNMRSYQRGFGVYRQLYKRLADLMHEVA